MSVRLRLERMWQELRRQPFPGIVDLDLAADFAEYDSHLAGLVSHVVETTATLPRRLATGEA